MKENVIQFFFMLSIIGPSAWMQGGLFLKACPRSFQVSMLELPGPVMGVKAVL